MAGQQQMLGGCGVCLDERGWKENPLVYCDGTGCDVAVHKNCYGITKVPSGPWYCQKCASRETGDQVRCCLCPRLKGVLKKTDDSRWAHVLCALYIPEIRFGNVITMDPIIVAGIPVTAFNSKPCYICDDNQSAEKHYGVCLQCFKPSCKVIFHVTCAQSKSLLTEEQGTEKDSVQYCGYCAQHSKKSSRSSKNQVPSSPGSNGQVKNAAGDVTSGNSSDDKKDFSTPLTVEIAEKPKPRSRARANNGTGGGKRTRKPTTKKGAAAAAALAKLSPQLKSPLRSPLRSPLLRSPPTLLSPGRSPISLVPSTAQGLLEQHFELGKKMLESQAPLDIAQLLTCISKIQHENEQLEVELKDLTVRRDHLVSINARLALPNTVAVSTVADNLTVNNYGVQSLPSHVMNGPISSITQSNVSKPTTVSQHMPITQPTVNTSTPLDMTSPASAQNQSTNKKASSLSNGGKEPTATSQARKRSSESVIKMSSKQTKQSTPPSIIKSSSGARGPTQPKSNPSAESHFQWPTPLPPASALAVCRSYSSASLDSVSARLPPINALSQSRTIPSSTHPSSTPSYLNMNPPASLPSYPGGQASTMASYTGGQASTLASYSSEGQTMTLASYPERQTSTMASYPSGTAAATALANYVPYSQFPMFGMQGLGGMAMPGIHVAAGQAYYSRPPNDAAGTAQGVNPNGGIQ